MPFTNKYSNKISLLQKSDELSAILGSDKDITPNERLSIFSHFLLRTNFESCSSEVQDAITKIETSSINEVSQEFVDALNYLKDNHQNGFQQIDPSDVSLVDLAALYAESRKFYRRASDAKFSDELGFKLTKSYETGDYEKLKNCTKVIGDFLKQKTAEMMESLSPDIMSGVARYMAIQEITRGIADERTSLQRQNVLNKESTEQKIEKELRELVETMGGDEEGRKAVSQILSQVFLRITSTSHPTNYFGPGLQNRLEAIYNLFESATKEEYGFDIDSELLDYLTNNGIREIFAGIHQDKDLLWHDPKSPNADKNLLISPAKEVERNAYLVKKFDEHAEKTLEIFNKAASRVLGEHYRPVEMSQISFAAWEGMDMDGREKENVESLLNAIKASDENPLTNGRNRVGEMRQNADIHNKMFSMLIKLTGNQELYNAYQDPETRDEALTYLISSDSNLLSTVFSSIKKPSGAPSHQDYDRYAAEIASFLKSNSGGEKYSDKDFTLVANTIARMTYLSDETKRRKEVGGRLPLTDSYIIANYEDISDYYEAMLLLKMTGNLEIGSDGKVSKTSHEIIPLVEDEKGIKSVREEFNKIKNCSICRSMQIASSVMYAENNGKEIDSNNLKPRQTVFFGNSDTGRHLGVPQAQFKMRNAQRIVSTEIFTLDEFETEIYIGSGFEAERGGPGFTFERMVAMMSSWLGFLGNLRVTALQGDAARRFGLSVEMAKKFVSSGITSLAKRTAKFLHLAHDEEQQKVEAQVDNILEAMADIAIPVYREQVAENPDIVSFIGKSGAWTVPFSASRGQRNITSFEGFRAIQVNLSTYLKGMSVLYYGFEESLKQLINDTDGEKFSLTVKENGRSREIKGLELAKWLYNNCEAFKIQLDNAVIAAEMTDREIASWYVANGENKNKDLEFGSTIGNSMAQIRVIAKLIAGEQYLFKDDGLRGASKGRSPAGILSHAMQAVNQDKIREIQQVNAKGEVVTDYQASNHVPELFAISDFLAIANHEAYQQGIRVAIEHAINNLKSNTRSV